MVMLIPHLVTAQKQITKPTKPKVYTVVGRMPQLPGGGGEKAILQAIQQRLVYPPRALQAQVEGRVYVNFIVTATGRVDKIEVVKSLVADCDSAVVQAVKRLPRFTPGREEGKAVWVQYTLPVTFRIED
ncbi:energy transducer TonB [Hymenobacter arizonensis]|nr:energy transducer TonB [Hymenobacter arizonensis]